MLNDTDFMIWYGTAESARQYLNQREQEARAEIRADAGRPESGDERFGPYDEFIQVEGNTAIVSISGSLSHKETWFTQFFGIMTYETIANISAILAADEGIENVLLDIDSPGGMAKGVDVASDAIKALRESGKPVHSHVSGSMMSAAYWLGSSAETVMASKNAELGSIGVIAVHLDLSKMHDELGAKFTVLRKGEEKALATPYEKLSDKGREQIERSMERSYTAFIDQVADNRGLPAAYVREKIATGREFSAQEAVELNLADEVISFNDAASKLVGASSESNETNWSKAAMSKKPILNAEATGLSAEDAATAIAAGIEMPELEAPSNLSASAESEDGNEEEAEAESTGEEAEAGEEEGEESAEVSVSEPTASSDNGMATLLSDLNGQLVEAKVQLDKANTQLAELTSANAGFRTIVIEQTQRMRIGLNQSAATDDLEKMSDQALVAAHQQVRDTFLDRFRVGATSRSPEHDSNAPKQVVTRLDRAIKKATSLR